MKQYLSKVLCSDESKYNLFSSDDIKYVMSKKQMGSPVHRTIKYRGGSVMV